MKIALIGLGSAILSALKSIFASTTGRAVIGTALFIALLALLPFEIGLPDEIMEVLTGDFVRHLFISLTFLFPLGFALKCLLILLMADHFELLFKIIRSIFNVIIGGGNSAN